MTYALLGLLLTNAVSAGLAFYFWHLVGDEKAKRSAEHNDLQAQISAGQLKAAIAADEKARTEKVVADLKAEIEIMEKDLELHSTPDSVRARLRELLSGATDETTPAVSVPRLPPRTTS